MRSGAGEPVFDFPRARGPGQHAAIGGYQGGCAGDTEAFGKRENGKLVPGPNYDEMIGILSNVLKQPPALVAAGLPFIARRYCGYWGRGT